MPIKAWRRRAFGSSCVAELRTQAIHDAASDVRNSAVLSWDLRRAVDLAVFDPVADSVRQARGHAAIQLQEVLDALEKG